MRADAHSRGQRRSKQSKQRACGKHRYRDRQEALAALRAIVGRSRRDKVVKRAYACDRCHGWHLTSWETP